MEKSELEKHLKDLEQEMYILQMSDDYCYTNGKYTVLNDKIKEVRKKLND